MTDSTFQIPKSYVVSHLSSNYCILEYAIKIFGGLELNIGA